MATANWARRFLPDVEPDESEPLSTSDRRRRQRSSACSAIAVRTRNPAYANGDNSHRPCFDR